MQRIIQIVTLSALMTTPALAQIFDGNDEVSGRNFAGVMGGRTELRTDDVPDLNFLTFTARIGHDFNQYFGLELRGGLTGDDEAEGIEASIPYFGSVLSRIGWLPGRRQSLEYLRSGWLHGRRTQSSISRRDARRKGWRSVVRRWRGAASH